MDNVSIEHLLQQLADQRALDLRSYKRSTLERRIKKRMGQVAVHDYSTYLDYVGGNPGELNTLLNTVLINVTEFFRDAAAWEYLAQKVLPVLLRDKQPGPTFRVWCAGCSSGEEVYSLGILLAEHFAGKISDYDVRIYATDIDEEALNVARHAEYPAEKLRRIRPEWRNKYFQPSRTRFRVNREIRRMVIFGRNNLTNDSPISHVNLLVCRNVLIYFAPEAQRQVLARLHYALEKEGVVFFGKAESQLSNSRLFVPISPRWRIFQRAEPGEERLPRHHESEGKMKAREPVKHEEVENLRLQQRYMLDNLGSGVITLDTKDVIAGINEFALAAWGFKGTNLVGKRLQQSELGRRYPELVEKLKSTRSGSEAHLRTQIQHDSEERVLSVVIKPMMANGDRRGTFIHCEDVTPREKLQATIEQLETTGEELQAANEELETTNEELQSTNEELETTNEELQSTNEELETTNEELQSLNEELENMNEELGVRTRELDALNLRYSDTLERMPWPVMVIGSDLNVQFWNSAAQRLFEISAKSVVGVPLGLLPIDRELRDVLLRCASKVVTSQKPAAVRADSLAGQRSGTTEIRFEPLTREGSPSGVLVMFGSPSAAPAKAGRAPAFASRSSRPKSRPKRRRGSRSRKK